MVKQPTTTETISLHKFSWFGHVQRMEEPRIPKKLGTTSLRCRPRTRWQNEVDGRMVGGEGWQDKYITERNGRSS
jgi:hypothetical protein